MSSTLSCCTILPKVEDKSEAYSLPKPAKGPLVEASNRLAGTRSKSESSFLLLQDAGEALKWRLAMIDSARSSIDIQLYLWHGGISSELLFERLLQAADRGVRVRVLVDDFLMKSDEAALATLCRDHPNFDARIFNPGRVRGNAVGGLAEMLANFKALNRRMHNKTFTADRCMTIVGGRNIGDHYYGMAADYNFIDLDVLVAGPVVADVAKGFDQFWNADEAYPAAMLSRKHRPGALEKSRERFLTNIAAEQDGRLRGYPVKRHDWRSDLRGLKGRMVHGEARFVQDNPDPERDDRKVVTSLRSLTRGSRGSLQFASPYLIPSDEGLENLKQMSSDGTAIEVLVPSLAANNHAVVDGHYRRYRKPLLEAGARLSEFRADPDEKVRALADVGTRSERVTLHLKAIVGDRRRCFIGSLNLDPRALRINTESGLLIESPELARELGAHIETFASDANSWQVRKGENGRLLWESRGEARSKAPPAKWSHRLLGWFAGLLPIESQI